uniref:ABC transporter substrate-binding protein n=1 Tax=Strongyloides papillosus TaxID=174720 RepID=A0A0N5CGF3_STREA
MNSFNLFIFIGILTSFSFGYKTNCTDRIGKPCVVYLAPEENDYQKLFLSSIDPVDKINYDIGLGPRDTDWNQIQHENKAIKKLDKKTIENFVKKLPAVGLGNDVTVEVVPHLYNVFLTSDFPKSETTQKPITWKDYKEANGKGMK